MSDGEIWWKRREEEGEEEQIAITHKHIYPFLARKKEGLPIGIYRGRYFPEPGHPSGILNLFLKRPPSPAFHGSNYEKLKNPKLCTGFSSML